MVLSSSCQESFVLFFFFFLQIFRITIYAMERLLDEAQSESPFTETLGDF